MDLDNEKELILEQSSSRTVVISAAGSGKTKLLTEKVRQVLKSEVDPSRIAVITFTNLASDRKSTRLNSSHL